MAENKYLKYKNNGRKFIKPTPDQMIVWIRRNNIPYKDFGEQIRICNPDGDDNFCMSISKSEALVHDFRPHHQQYDGSFIKFVSKFVGVSYKEAVKIVCGDDIKYSHDILFKPKEEEIRNEIELPDGCVSIREKNDSKLRKINLSYLINERGLDEDIIYRANIHYLGTTIVIPYYHYGMIVYYQSRRQLSKIFEFPKESVTSKKAGDFLYGYDDVEPCSEVTVVESIFNCLSIGDDTVATGGAKLKDGQIELLKSLNPKSVILAPDNDKAGRESIIKDYLALSKLRSASLFQDIWYSLPPYSSNESEQMDWNDMKRNKINIKEYIKRTKRKVSMSMMIDGVDYKFK